MQVTTDIYIRLKKKHDKLQSKYLKRMALVASVLSLLMLSLVVLFPVARGSEKLNASTDLPKMIGVLEFADNPSPRYIHQSFSNYFHLGDKVDFRGYVMQIHDWYKPLHAITNVKIQGPDGSIIIEESNIATDENNSFELAFEITPEFRVGKYLASVAPVKSGYTLGDNEYLTPFYVFQNNSHTVTVSSHEYSIVVGSIQFRSSNMKFDTATNQLSFNVERLAGNYTADGDIGYPGHFLFVLIERPLIEGTLQYRIDNGMDVWQGAPENERFHIMQVGVDDIHDKATVTVWGNP